MENDNETSTDETTDGNGHMNDIRDPNGWRGQVNKVKYPLCFDNSFPHTLVYSSYEII